MAGLRLAIDPTGMEAGGKKAEDALDAVKRKAVETEAATDKTGRKFTEAGDKASAAAPKVKVFGTEVGSVAGVAAKAGAALVALAGTFAASVSFRRFLDATVTNANAQAQLAAAIASTGGAAQRSVSQLNSHAAALQKLTTFGDEATNAAQGLLLTFTNIRGDTFDAATVAAQNLATAMRMDLSSAALQVGKALNDPILGMTALTRSGIQFSDAQKAAVRQMVETNNIAGAQAIILAELEKQFGGSAEAARNTLGGALKALGNAWGDVFEIGNEASDGLRLAVERLVTTISDPRFIASVQAIGTAMFDAAAVAARALAFVVDNADILAATLGLLAARQLPAVAAGFYAMATGAGAATVATGALAAALNLLPWVALATGAALVFRAYRNIGDTTGVTTAVTDRLKDAVEALDAASHAYATGGGEAARQTAIETARAMEADAAATLAAVEARLALAQESGANNPLFMDGASRPGGLLHDLRLQTAAANEALEGARRTLHALLMSGNGGGGTAAASVRDVTGAVDALTSAVAQLGGVKFGGFDVGSGNVALLSREMELLRRAQEGVIRQDAAAALRATLSAAQDLQTEIGLTATGMTRYHELLQAVRTADTFTDQARAIGDVMRFLDGATGGARSLDAEARQVYAALRDALGVTIKLSSAFDNMSLGAVAGQAAHLAAQLGISLDAANALNAAMNRNAGLPDGSARTTGLSFGVPSVGDPSMGDAPLGFGPLTPGAPKPRRVVHPMAPEAPAPAGRGGGAAQIDLTRQAYDALMASLDPVVRATQDFAAAQEVINAAMAAGHITVTDAAAAYDLARERFDDAVNSVRNGSYVWEQFQSAGASAIDRLIAGTGTLKEALGDMLKQMALAIANKRILAAGGTAVSSIGGLVMNAFAGLFDSGGTIGMGQFGIVGERGPEIVTSTGRGAVVTSRTETARQMGGQRAGGTVINIDARGAQMGVAEQIEDRLRAVVPQIVGQSAQTVRESWGAWQNEYDARGALA
jgi:hypothetical protein